MKDPAITTLGIYLRKLRTQNQKDMCTHMFSAALFYNDQDMEAT